MTGALVDEDRVRAILMAQATTSHRLKQARARLVIRCVQSGMKAAEMWARVDIDTAELAEAAALADVEAKVLWWTRGVAPEVPTISEDDLFA